MKLSAVFAVALSLVLAAGVMADDTKKDLEKMQGEWTVISIEGNGQKVAQDQLKELKLTIKGDKFTYESAGQKAMDGTIKIDATKKPKTLDAKGTDAAGTAQESIGIYEFEGDTLKVCFVTPGNDRPKDFKTDAGQNIVIYKKAKP